jgi:hypothetical protein
MLRENCDEINCSHITHGKFIGTEVGCYVKETDFS